MRTIVYVDGFNLYYGAVSGTRHKWLDLGALFRNVLAPHHQILGINYYTAKVSARPGDPDLPIRQQTYHNAIQAHTPNLSVVLGHFLSSTPRMKLVTPINGQQTALVHKPEEKGSDVNLALHVLHDAWRDRYECAVVVSNDSDLSEALRIVKVENGEQVREHRAERARQLRAG